MSTSKPQISLHATIHVGRESINAYLTALRPAWASCAAEVECLFFDVFQDSKDPGLFRFVEIWAGDQEWFKTKQLTKSYYVPYIAATQPLWIEPPKMEFFERKLGWSVYSQRYLDGGG